MEDDKTTTRQHDNTTTRQHDNTTTRQHDNTTTLELESKLIEIEKNRVEIQKFVNESFKSQAEGSLANKKAKWYELVMFGGAGITIGLALAKIFGG